LVNLHLANPLESHSPTIEQEGRWRFGWQKGRVTTGVDPGGGMFVQRLLSHDRGIIVCCNILQGLDAGLYDTTFVKMVFDWWEALCNYLGITDGDKTIYLLRDLGFDPVLKKIPPAFRPGRSRPSLSFMARRTLSKSSRNELICTIIPAERLREKISDADLLRLENTHYVRFPSARHEWTTDVIQRLQRLTEAERTFQVRDGESLHPICLWYTKAKDLLLKLRGLATASNAARDVLGLIHYDSATPLVALYFSHSHLLSSEDDRPTFIEAADNRRFQSQGYAPASIRQKGWGRTADLARIAQGKSIIDGCPERISKPTPHSFQLKFEILGLTSGLRGNIAGSDTDTDFARFLMKRQGRFGWDTRDKIENYLRSVLA